LDRASARASLGRVARVASLVVVAFGVWLGGVQAAQASRRVFLWFADGAVPPKGVGEICLGGRPPAFRCAAGPVDTCRREILTLLDRWYADADVVFTFVEPSEGAFDTVALTSDGAWCDADTRTVSRSPLPLCTVVPRGSIAIFRCGEDAKACATLVAKEQAHLLGLQHSTSVTDVMNELGGTLHDGFEDRDNALTSARCGRQQNSFQLLLERAGRWPGGPKPDPGVPVRAPVVGDGGLDGGAGDGGPESGGADAGAGPEAAPEDVAAGPADAGLETSPIAPVDAAGGGSVPGPGSTTKSKSGGCVYAPASAGAGPFGLFWLAGVVLGAGAWRYWRRRGDGKDSVHPY
jgi:hypothetical protein